MESMSVLPVSAIKNKHNPFVPILFVKALFNETDREG